MTSYHIYETTKDTDHRLTEILPNERIYTGSRGLSCVLSVNPDLKFQTVQGFGCALTESSAFVLSELPETSRKAIIESCFSLNAKESNCYKFVRTHMNSCDFSLENWSCLPEQDNTLSHFSMERMDRFLTPILQTANGKNRIELMISPWSPPAWMKTNGSMNNGGKLIEDYRQLWADYYVRFIQELKKRELSVRYISIQNEPEAIQQWDSCCWTGKEEGDFAVTYLGPALEKAGFGNCILLVWDHNRDRLFDRMNESMSVPGADKFIGGAAFHWYSGDQYDQVKKTSRTWPNKQLVFSEGCIEGGTTPGAWFQGERYAHNIINDLNSGCTCWIDWNAVLDMKGGPNHTGNYCDAEILVDSAVGTCMYQSSYWYIGHFSRFIQPGAVRLGVTMTPKAVPAAVDGCMGCTMESCAFCNPDGTIVLVVCNRTEADMIYELEPLERKLYCPPRSIQTLVSRKNSD